MIEDLFSNDVKWDLVQFRVTPDLKDKISQWCKHRGLTVSVYLRMVCAKTLQSEMEMHDPRQLQPITNAVADVVTYVPVVVRNGQLKRY